MTILFGIPSGGEWLIVLIIVVLVFGASRLPQLGEGIGKAVRNLKRGLKENDDIEVTPKDRQVSSETPASRSVTDEVSDAEVVEESKRS